MRLGRSDTCAVSGARARTTDVPGVIPGPAMKSGMRISVSYGSIFSIGMRNWPRWYLHSSPPANIAAI